VLLSGVCDVLCGVAFGSGRLGVVLHGREPGDPNTRGRRIPVEL
jgi:hypothetical protein